MTGKLKLRVLIKP